MSPACTDMPSYWETNPTGSVVSKQFLIFFGVGVVAIAIALVAIFAGTKGSHLELKGKIMKIRTGALGDQDSIAVLDFRVENPSDVPFVVRQVEVSLEEKDGSMAEGANIAKGDLKGLFQYNRFLGDQLNDALTIKDTIPPHTTVDRMVASRFDVTNRDLGASKAIHLSIQDVDGPLLETSSKRKVDLLATPLHSTRRHWGLHSVLSGNGVSEVRLHRGVGSLRGCAAGPLCGCGAVDRLHRDRSAGTRRRRPAARVDCEAAGVRLDCFLVRGESRGVPDSNARVRLAVPIFARAAHRPAKGCMPRIFF